MANNDVNYIATYFKYDPLTKAEKQPDYTTLKQIKDILKANTASVTSNLGGGNHGHLGRVLTNAEYAHASAIPYVAQGHPGPLNIPAGATQFQI